jgi:anti-sigma factor ChrR (cupin superfamily)
MPERKHRNVFASEIVWGRGTQDGVQYARLLMDEQDSSSPLIVLAKFEPGVKVDAHTHDTNYFEYVIEGEQTVGKLTFRAGDLRFANAGTGYGPITIGSHGCTVLIVFQQASGARTVPVGLARELAQTL